MKKFKGHQNNSGKPSTNRGRAPHKNGYHAAHGDCKSVNHKRIWYEYLDPMGKRVRCNSPWNPGK